MTTALFINPRLSLEVVRDLDFSSDEADEAVQRALRNATGYWRRGREIVLQKFDKALKTFRALRSTSGIEPSSLVAPAFNALLAEYQRLALPSDRLLENVAAYHYIKSLRGRVCALPDQARHELSSGKNYDLRSAEGDVVGDGAAYIYLGAGLLTVLCAFLAAPTGGFMGVLGAIVIVGFISFVVATITVLGMEAGIKSERRAEAERFRRDCAEISRLSNVVLWE